MDHGAELARAEGLVLYERGFATEHSSATWGVVMVVELRGERCVLASVFGNVFELPASLAELVVERVGLVWLPGRSRAVSPKDADKLAKVARVQEEPRVEGPAALHVALDAALAEDPAWRELYVEEMAVLEEAAKEGRLDRAGLERILLEAETAEILASPERRAANSEWRRPRKMGHPQLGQELLVASFASSLELRLRELRYHVEMHAHPGRCDCKVRLRVGVPGKPESPALRLLPGTHEEYVCDACDQRWDYDGFGAWSSTMLGTMDITIESPMLPTRPCRFCLDLQGGSVFADFDVDPDGRVFAVRISFDGYGCCQAPAGVGRMSARDSAALLAMVGRGSIDATAASILRGYFRDVRDAFWSDALAHHGLL